MATVFVLANQKGGVGKTTSTYNLGVALAELGQQVLLVDLDPQGGLTYYAGFEPESLGQTIYHCLLQNQHPATMIVSNKYGVDVLPANVDLSIAEFQLMNAAARERRVARIINKIRDDYDYILIDSQPSLGLLTINALVAADQLIIPVSCEYLSVRGTQALLFLVSKIKMQLNSGLIIAGLLPTMVDFRTVNARQILELLRSEFPGQYLFPHVVARSVRFAESTAQQIPVFAVKQQVPGAKAYRELANDLVQSK